MKKLPSNFKITYVISPKKATKLLVDKTEDKEYLHDLGVEKAFLTKEDSEERRDT